MNMPNSFDLAIITGFGDKGINELKTNLDQNLQPQSSRVIASAPASKALHSPETIIAEVTGELDSQPSKDLLFIGHSYGAFIALIVACRRKLEGIFKLILIDGPLRSDVEVKPAKLLHNAFFRHYAERPALAKECEDVLIRLHTDKIITLGTSSDSIVPPESKTLATNEIQVRLRSRSSAENYQPPIRQGGVNIVVDMPEMAGHNLTKDKASLYGQIIKNML